jgi:hypothetical protein
MATYLRKTIAMGPANFLYPGSSQDPRYFSNTSEIQATRSHQVKLWVDWSQLEPVQGQLNSYLIGQLDQQITALRNAGNLGVILTVHHAYPRWANGTTSAQLAAMSQADRNQLEADRQGKPYEARIPSDCSVTGPWATFISFIANRYNKLNPNRPGPNCHIDFLEVVNEPNGALWPQSNIHCVVGQMFQTAQTITDYTGGEPGLMGPATWDGNFGDTQQYTSYPTFQYNLISLLISAQGWTPRSNFCWTIHQYGDVETDNLVTAPVTQQLLTGKWNGMGGISTPWVWVTESGYRVNTNAAISAYPDANQRLYHQADVVGRNFTRMNNDTDGRGRGIASACVYLNYTDRNFDTGLHEPAEDPPPYGGARRPVFNTWASLPEYP